MKEIYPSISTTTIHLTTKNDSTIVTHSGCDLPVQSTLEDRLYCCFMAMILITSVVGNGIVIVAVFLSKKLTRSTFYFVGSLAVSDTIITIFQAPFRISVRLHHMTFCFATSVCFIRMIMDVVGNIASILNLLFISIDRFIAIQLPYRYLEYLAKRRCKQIIASIWMFAITLSSSGIFRWRSTNSTESIISIKVHQMCINVNEVFFNFSFLGVFIPALVLMTFAYMKILQIALGQIRKMKRRATVVSAASPSVHDLAPNGNDGEKPRRRTLSKLPSVLKELKTTKSIATVYVAFCICWLPSCIIHIIFLFKSDFTLSRTAWYIFADILPIMSTTVNPFIYGFLNKEFRNAVQYMWRKLLVRLNLRDSYLTRKETARVTYVRSNPALSGIQGYGELAGITSNSSSPVCVNKYAG